MRYKTIHSLYEWTTLTESLILPGTSSGNTSDTWSPPPDVFIRLDFDGSLNPFIGSAGNGGVHCDEMGLTLMHGT